MSEIRVPDTMTGYTVVPNGLLPTGDAVISARAWGIYVYLLSRPPGWECRAYHLGTVFREGRDAVYTALRELVEAGLMAKETYLHEGMPRQRFALRDPRPAPDTDSQDPGNPNPGNPSQVTTEVNQTKTEPKNTSPTGSGARPSRAAATVADDDPHWSRFWSLYPRKLSKADARKAWVRALPKVDTPAVLIRAVERYVAGVTDLKYVPYPASWLNGERWLDDDLRLNKPNDTRPRNVRVGRDEECPIHAGQHKDRCAGCRADALASDAPVARTQIGRR